MGHTANARAQHVPSYVIVGAALVIPVTVAVVNHLMVLSDLKLMELKFSLAEDVMVNVGLLPGVAVLVGMAVGFALVATCLVNFGAPICAGSGIPEVLGFLNGNSLPGLFTLRGFCVRVAAIVLVQCAGFPVGREGPMVAIGGSVGFGVAWLLLRPTEKRWEQVVASQDDSDTCRLNLASTPLVLNEERFAHVRRVGCALGGAAGLATAFNAPIGSVLYMFEELAVSSLPPDLARFMCTVFATLAARALLQMTDMNVHRLVIYNENAKSPDAPQGSWDWYDVPLMVILSLVLGFGGAFFSKALLASWSFRRKMAARFSEYQPWAKIAECVVYCVIVSFAWGLVPAFFDCVEYPTPAPSAAGDGHGGHASSGHRMLSGDSQHLSYARYACPEGQYNEVATYLLSGAEGAVKHLYSPSSEVQRSGPLAVTLVFYFVLACGMPGLSVPMGTFVPSMLVGALAGRLFGENAQLLHHALHLPGPILAPPGVYAVVGSASVLAGLTHMTVGVVALLAEAIGDFGLIGPLMLAVLVAQTASKLCSHFGYDEHLIIMKGIPFLDPEIPKEMEAQGIVAGDICEFLPDEALLPARATVKAIKRALRQRSVKYFPIIAEGSICIGLTTRGRLEAVQEAVKASKRSAAIQARLQQRRPSVGSNSSAASNASTISDASSADSSDQGRSSASPCKMNSFSGFSIRQSTGRGHLHDVQTEAKLASFIKAMFTPKRKGDEDHTDSAKDADERLPVDRIMDSAPHAICEDMPVSRFYHMFNKMGASVSIVVSKRGKFRGILSRTGLIDAQAKLHTGYHFKGRESVCSSTISGNTRSSTRSSILAGDLMRSVSGDLVRSVSEQTAEDTSEAEVRIEHPSHSHIMNSDLVANAVAGNMAPEELQGELTKAWKKISDGEKVQDELSDLLRASEERVRELELRLGNPQALTGVQIVPNPAVVPNPADVGVGTPRKGRAGGSRTWEQHSKKHIVVTCATARCFW